MSRQCCTLASACVVPLGENAIFCSYLRVAITWMEADEGTRGRDEQDLEHHQEDGEIRKRRKPVDDELEHSFSASVVGTGEVVRRGQIGVVA